MHIEQERAGTHDPGGYGESAETYLRLLAETALRSDGPASRVRPAADILVDAGVLTEELASQIVADMQTALRVRGRQPPRAPAERLRRLTRFRPAPGFGSPAAPAPWRVLPAGPATPGARLMALILTADRALAPATLFFPPADGPPESGIPPFVRLTGTDDVGTSYRLGFSDGDWAGSTWTGTVMFLPSPPPAARWLAIIGPNGQLLRADITAAAQGRATPSAAPDPDTPGERLLTRYGEAMLAALALGYPVDDAQPRMRLTVATLEGAGALAPLSPAPARLAALGQLLGMGTEGPAEEVPARWTDVIAHYGRKRRLAPVTGTAAIAAELPELDGARFAVAGLRSGGAGSFLHVLAEGLRGMPRRRLSGPPPDTGFSWWLRDDADGWHLGVFEDVSPVGGPDGIFRLALLPPLDHATTSLTADVRGFTQRVSANLKVRW